MNNFKMLILVLVLMVSSLPVYAQYKMIFEHPEIDKTYEVKNGDYLKLRYIGYVDQESEVENYISEISPVYVRYTPPTGKNKLGDDQVIMIEDITGFKQMSKMRPFMPSLISLGVGVGIYYSIGENDNFNNTEQLLYSLGASIGTSLLINWIFKTDVKLKISDGWTVKIVSASY